MAATIGVKSQPGPQRRGSQLMKSSTFAGACIPQESVTFPVSNRILQRSSTNMKVLEESVSSGSRTFDLMDALQKMRLEEIDESDADVTDVVQQADAADSDDDSGIGNSPNVITSTSPSASPTASASTSDRDADRGAPHTEDASAKPAMPKQQLSPHAWQAIQKHLLSPIVNRKDFSPFFPLVRVLVAHAKSGEIASLRNLEKRLLIWSVEFSRTKGIASSTYSAFCYFVIECLVTIAPLLTEKDKCGPREQAYTINYFILLAGQVRQYAAVLERLRKASREDKDSRTADEKIFIAKGSNHTGGRPEFVRREKDGTLVNLATGRCHNQTTTENESPAAKRNSPLDEPSDGEADSEAERSMARRKKDEPPINNEQTCEHCHRVFKRTCDLTKHAKTHSRPWKCPETTCRYAQFGWPTEKELERHFNDKHSLTPRVYRCIYPPCTYESKRESNCKQHMEKLHGYTYNRTKKSGRNKDVPNDLQCSTLTLTPETSVISTVPSAVDYADVSSPSTMLTNSRSTTIDSNPIQTPASMMSMPFSSTRESSASICGDQGYPSIHTPIFDAPSLLDNEKNPMPFDMDSLSSLQYPSASLFEAAYYDESGGVNLDSSESFGPVMPQLFYPEPMTQDVDMQDLSIPNTWLDEMNFADINPNANFSLMGTVDPIYAQYSTEMDSAMDPFRHPC